MQHTRLRLMESADLPAVLHIQREAYGDHYQESAAVLGRKLALAPGGCRLAERHGKTAAYVFAHPWRTDGPPPLHAPLVTLPGEADCVFVHDLAVSSAARGGGVAAGLLRDIAAWAVAQGARCLTLVALADAVAYWARHGFAPAGGTLPPGYGEGALFMSRPLAAKAPATAG